MESELILIVLGIAATIIVGLGIDDPKTRRALENGATIDELKKDKEDAN
jgi:hypothetical protein